MKSRRFLQKFAFSLVGLLFVLVGSAQLINEHEFLPVDEAYPTQAKLNDDGYVVASWVMPEGYYLYKHAFKLIGKDGTQLGELQVPDGLKKTDEFFGEVEVYYNYVEISAQVLGQAQESVVVEVHYQGCADAGLCYPPEAKKFELGIGSLELVASPNPPAPLTSEVSLFVALGSALLAGLILNLMPCVFPVLSIKALAVIQNADADESHLPQALGYLAGVVATFLALALLLVFLRSLGAAIGWGFQLQSPGFVAAMALLFWILSLNMVGFVEIPGFGVSMTQPNAFLTGVLAVIVATPCTVPFMAAAISVAITQGGMALILIMAAMGVGMAVPYVFVTAVPHIARWLPRPGSWMVTFKRVMAIPLVLTVVWLLWVMSRQLALDAVVLTIGAMVVLAVAAFVGGRQVRWLTSVWAVMLLVVAGAVYAVNGPLNSKSASQEAPFVFDKFLATLSTERPLFLNVTADWCLTCLTNERTTLSRASVQEAFSSHGVAYVKVDWTNRDAEVSKLLENYGRYGVPMYVYYPVDEPPIVLPQVLTPGMVLDLLTDSEGKSS